MNDLYSSTINVHTVCYPGLHNIPHILHMYM